MGWTCRKHGQRKICGILNGKKTGREKTTLETEACMGVILKWIVKTSCGDVDWINVALDKAQRQGLVNVITDIGGELLEQVRHRYGMKGCAVCI